VKDVDFDQGLVFVRGGKGAKDRSTLLAEVGRDELRDQLRRAKGQLPARDWLGRYTAGIMRAFVLLFLVTLCASSGVLAESAAGIRWTAPSGWKAEAPRPMRAATYTIAVVPGDRGPAECVVNYFGPGQGGTVDANVARWRAQVLGGDGKPAAATVTTRTVRGVKITVVDSTGAYTGMGGPMAAGKPVSGYRLLGAIAEGKGGNVFFKLTGPSKTIAAQQAAFERMLASIQPE
jgi:hypothetical protein